MLWNLLETGKSLIYLLIKINSHNTSYPPIPVKYWSLFTKESLNLYKRQYWYKKIYYLDIFLLYDHSPVSPVEYKENPYHSIWNNEKIEYSIIETLSCRTATFHVTFSGHFTHGALRKTLNHSPHENQNNQECIYKFSLHSMASTLNNKPVLWHKHIAKPEKQISPFFYDFQSAWCNP